MKIQVISSGNNKAKVRVACPFFVESPPDGDGAPKSASK